MTPEQLAKLPKWAQREIEVLQMRHDELSDRLKGLQEPSRIWVDPYDEHRIPVEDRRSGVRFLLTDEPVEDPGGRRHPYIDVRINPGDRAGDPPCLELMASHGITIAPQVSNVVRVWDRRS